MVFSSGRIADPASEKVRGAALESAANVSSWWVSTFLCSKPTLPARTDSTYRWSVRRNAGRRSALESESEKFTISVSRPASWRSNRRGRLPCQTRTLYFLEGTALLRER